jgi:hypothetical protein
MKDYTKEEMMEIVIVGMDKYYYNGDLGSLAAAKRYFFETTNNQYSQETYELFDKCFCEYGLKVIDDNCKKNGYVVSILGM